MKMLVTCYLKSSVLKSFFLGLLSSPRSTVDATIALLNSSNGEAVEFGYIQFLIFSNVYASKYNKKKKESYVERRREIDEREYKNCYSQYKITLSQD